MQAHERQQVLQNGTCEIVHEARPRSLHQQIALSERGGTDELDPGTKMQKLRVLSSKTKEKTMKILHVDGGGSSEREPISDKNDALAIIECDPAFNPHMLNQQKPANTGISIKKARETLRSIATSMVHPMDSVKSKAAKTTAGKLSNAERPYLSQEADLHFLNAHNNLDRAYSARSSRQGTSEEEDSLTRDHKFKVQEMEAHRESLRVAWITSRHISRVRVVPRRQIKFPSTSYFTNGAIQRHLVRSELLEWLGRILIYHTQDFSAQYVDDFDELPFDIDSLRHHVERLVMASAPWQSWAMDMRSIYRWENPQTTFKWLAIYIFLWYTEHLMGFLWLYIIYLVLKNRFFPTSVGSLRESMQRALDSQGTAYRFGEIIDKHGRDSWLEPLINELGPYIQLQLGDVANMLEVFHNFYHWKSPRKTAASLTFIAACLLVSVFADMAFCMRIVGFIVGGCFFLCWPISSLYPKYRYLVSPFKWVLWDIPTHAEWSFQYLRRQAQITREQMIQKKVLQEFQDETSCSPRETYTSQNKLIPGVTVKDSNTVDNDEDWHSVSSSTSILDASDILSFRAYSHGVVGRLIIYSEGIRFVRSLTKKEVWKRTFLELAEIRKLEGSLVSKITMKTFEQLEIKFIGGDSLLLEKMRNRDEAFNAIIGFSSLQWQALQTESFKASKSVEKGK